ncbi:unnamed protein product [Prorocentrum cordatum]|uniref:Peroxisomal membrane protein MPV17 n=2 Tax=Prorocentrum TaxID=2944 RepID=A0ABN9QF10_9DINO|nr:Peroxisomal membrane protein MPV17 [Prorocentrum minimum]CAK0802173.1 unnamed protein product [Polarella glacialis]
MLQSICRKYSNTSKAYPLAAKCCTSFAVFGSADAASQLIVNQREDFSVMRSVRFATIGGCVMAPLFTAWYQFLDPMLPGKQYWYAKVLLECVSIGPLYLGVMIWTNAALQGLSLSEQTLRVRQDWWPLFINALKVVPAYQSVNFLFVPVEHRILWLNACQFMWNVFVAYSVASRSSE